MPLLAAWTSCQVLLETLPAGGPKDSLRGRRAALDRLNLPPFRKAGTT